MSHELLARTFDTWAGKGRDAEMEAEHGDVARQVIAAMGIKPGQQILDLGCGNGWATRILAKSSPGGRAVGVDVSPAMVARAEALHSLTIRARYEVMPFERLAFKDGQFDRAFSMEALYYAVDLDAALGEVHRVLKGGGSLDVLVDYYQENPAIGTWAKACGVPMTLLGEADWTARLERAGFTGVTSARVIDSREVDAAGFDPGACYPDLETYRRGREAGSLWLRGTRA
jgi:SAM-dependent methyltransferase